jgi:hypothetical protein
MPSSRRWKVRTPENISVIAEGCDLSKFDLLRATILNNG